MSPSVRAGRERECVKDDFISLSGKPIGEGAFGDVYKVKHRLTGNIFAIKVVNK